VSIIERKNGTYLEFRDKDTNECHHEVLVSPSMRVYVPPTRNSPFQSFGHQYHQALTLTTPPEEIPDPQETDQEPMNTSEEMDNQDLHQILDSAIIGARNLSPHLDPPLPVEAYSPIRQLGGVMLAQALKQHHTQ